MKAIVYTKYGSPDALQFKEVEKPTSKDNEVLAKVQAASPVTRDKRIFLPLTPFLPPHGECRAAQFYYYITPALTFCKSNPYRPAYKHPKIKPITRLIGRGFTGSLITDHRHVVPRARFELATKGL